jgi:hypothetical protein
MRVPNPQRFCSCHRTSNLIAALMTRIRGFDHTVHRQHADVVAELVVLVVVYVLFVLCWFGIAAATAAADVNCSTL